MKELTGFLIINKPKDVTSYDCVRHIQNIIGHNIKVSHMGTLDPYATGVLIMGIGDKATKESQRFLTLDKEYIATAKLGELTDTLDYTGKIIKEENIEQLTRDQVQKGLDALGSEYLQQPPVYSALKYKGKPLYFYARHKKLTDAQLHDIVRMRVKFVSLYRLSLDDFDCPYFTLKAHVSHGTYIRSLVNDIALKIGTCATLYKLKRTKIGQYTIENAVHLENIKTVEDINLHIQAIDLKK